MALVKTTLQAGLQLSIAAAFKDVKNAIQESDDPDATIDLIAQKLAEGMSTDIDSYVRSALVSTQVTTVVATTGTAVAQAGSGSGSGTGFLA